MTKQIAIIVIVFLTTVGANAQYNSRLGRFTVDQKKGCAPFTVTLTNNQVGDCTPAKPCAMDYEGNSTQQQNVFTHVYSTPGTYKLSVLYQSIGADDITIVVDENITPQFEIYSCAASGVSIKINDTNYQQYVIDFNNDGTPETIIPNSNNQVASFNYGAAGPKNINVRGRNLNSADNCSSNVQSFDAIVTFPPAARIATLTLLDATRLKLDFTLLTHFLYKLEIAVNNSTTFQLYQTFYDTPSITIPNLNTDDNFYCFRLSTFDPCNGTNTYSPVICSQNFDLDIQSGVNKLAWLTSTTGVQNVEINRDQVSYTVIPGAPTSFNDVDITCKTNYCYQVINHYNGGSKSISLEKCGVSFLTTTPTAINNASAVVKGQSVELTWVQTPPDNPSTYSVRRTQDQQVFGLLETVNGRSYVDDTYTTEGNFCYRIDYTDDCDNQAPDGATICPLRLTGSMDNQNIVSISWNEYLGWENDVKAYVIEKYDKDGELIRTINNGKETSFVDDQYDAKNQVVTYVIRAVPNQDALTRSISNVITFTKESNIFYPTAFTPNGDKLNDGFFVSGQYLVKIELTIFNRWGEMVYNSPDNEPWNGMVNGKPGPEEAYIWSANITDRAGRTFKQSGTIALLRTKR